MTERISRPRERKKEAIRAFVAIHQRLEGHTDVLQSTGLPKIQPGRKNISGRHACAKFVVYDRQRHPEEVERVVAAIRYEYRPPKFYQPTKVHPGALYTPSWRIMFSSPDWITIPFIGMPQDAHQRLADNEFMIPVCIQGIQIEGSLRVFFEIPIPPDTDTSVH